MSKYTTEVRYICEVAAGLDVSTDYKGVEDVIKKALPVVFDFSFPIFDENYRSVLETKILKHFYTREIGLETVGLWKLKLDTKLNEIMPYFNQLYKSQLYAFNPFYDVDLTRKHRIDGSGTKDTDTTNNTKAEHRITVDENGSTSSNGSGSSDSESANTNVSVNTDAFSERYSDTPQGALTDLKADKYLTNATLRDDNKNANENNTGTDKTSTKSDVENTENKNTETNGNNSTTVNGNISSTLTNTEDYLETVQGKNGGSSYSKLLMEYRETFINIDMMVLDELEDLFMQLW
uniref:Lower collar protein n=1 Tax=Podoviridae sp. ctV3c15 TaxID=2826559 RepID=A0A8S5MRU8_9CAUD|nr:MAG TPA: Lower collar protein [Podoviridae sp. ctV3c15]